MPAGLEILNLHAQGGMAEVYRARAVDETGKSWHYAVKRMLPELLKEPEMMRMFLEEQRIAACLIHPNVVRVYDVAQADTSDTFIVMEFLEGRDLSEVIEAASLKEKPLPVWFCIHVAREVLKALHYATTIAKDKSGKALGLIHRDISPHNIFVCRDGQVKLTDFGVAKVAQSSVL
ncbi:MAG TPA: serine/threonine-protein kinase, partial [Myxococcota bacterium]